MEKLLYALLAITILFSCSVKKVTLEDTFLFEDNIEIDSAFQNKISDKLNKIRDVREFFHRIGHLESSNRYHVQAGSYYGRYQMGRLAMKDIDLDIHPKRFLASPEIQDRAMVDYTLKNREYLQKYIDKYAHTNFDGLHVTEAGILASAHLGGNLSVKIYFDTNGHVEFKDGNGTSVRDYMEKFQDLCHFDLGDKNKYEISKILKDEPAVSYRIEKNHFRR